MKAFLAFVVGMLTFCSFCEASIDPSSLDAWLDFTYRRSLVAVDETSFAWVECNRHSGCNVMLASQRGAASLPPLTTSLTAFAADDGLFEIAGLVRCSAGLVFVRRPIDGANPTRLRNPPTGSVWLITFAPGQLKQIVNPASSFLWAGELGVYVMEGRSLMLYNYDTSIRPSAILTLQADQGTITNVRDREDGTILFTNDRGDRALVGVFNINTDDSYRVIGASFDLLLGPAIFNPFKSDEVAFVKLFNVYGANGIPTSINTTIMLGSIAQATAEPIVVFFGQPDANSEANGHRELSFTSSDTLVFPIIGAQGFDPFSHVASINVRTGVATDIFAGHECDALSYFVVPGGKDMLLVTHNCFTDTVDTQSVSLHDLSSPGSYSLLVAGSEETMNGLAGEREYGAVLTNSGLAFFQSTWNTSLAVMYGSGSNYSNVVRISFADRPFPEPLLQPKSIRFQSDPFTIHGQLLVPLGATSKVPAVVFTHGGPMRQIYQAFHPTWDYAFRYAINQWLAHQGEGVAVLSINYRMGVGYGTKFQYCDGCGPLGAAEYTDVRNAGIWLQTLDGVDPNRIGIYGLSYGGLNALQAATRDPSIFRVAVANAPVFNWVGESRFDGDFYTMTQSLAPASQAIRYLPSDDLIGPSWPSEVRDTIKLFYESSPVAFLSENTSATLLIQGDSDRDVAVQNSIGMQNLARARGLTQISSLFFPNEMHGLSLLSSQSRAAQATVKFLLDVLMPADGSRKKRDI